MTSLLLQKYIETHPDDVVSKLRDYPISEIAALLETLDEDSFDRMASALKLSTILSLYQSLSDDRLCRYLQMGPPEHAELIYLQLKDDKLAYMQSNLPKRVLNRLEQKIKLQNKDIADFLDMDFLVISGEDGISETIKKMQKHQLAYGFVCDSNDKLTGMVTVKLLLANKGAKHIHEVQEKVVYTISIDSEIDDVIENKGWQQQAVLPVIKKDKTLVGMIRLNRIYDYMINTKKSTFIGFFETVAMTYVKVVYQTLNTLLSKRQ